jgi:hypothetical protein
MGGIGSTRKGVQLDIDRIFAGEICVLAGGVKFTADSVLCGVLKVTFRNVLLPTLTSSFLKFASIASCTLVMLLRLLVLFRLSIVAPTC